MEHRTQILYTVDISIINLHLELKPGYVVIESGTGSGALSTSIARCISPNGKLYTFEFNKDRSEAATKDFQKNKIDHIITVTWRDVCKEGFQLKEVANAVFLDLPSPWTVVTSAKEALVENGKLCSFSPCIEQVQRTCLALREAKFVDLWTIECLLRPYDVRYITVEKLNLNGLEEKNNSSEQKISEERNLKRSRNTFEAEQDGKELEKKEEEEEELEKEEEDEELEPTKEEKMEVMKTVDNKSKLSRGEAYRAFQAKIIEKSGVVNVRPFSDARGHTGFLTFARKAVVIRET